MLIIKSRPSAVFRLWASKIHRQRVSICASCGSHSQRYGCIKYPWWNYDNVQTYMELMYTKELQDRLLSRNTKNSKTIARTSEKHDLRVQHKDHHIRLKLLSKCKTKIASEQKTGKSINHRNRSNKKGGLVL